MGPLAGVRIVEFAGIGPGPFAGMMLADMGASIVRVERPGASPAGDPRKDIVSRGRCTLPLDLKEPAGRDAALRLITHADALIEGFRPGVMERLGLGPAECHARNARLVYGRMTGWGQAGPLSQAAGHDLNYISLCGALWSMGETGRAPAPPLNLLGDYGAGGMLLAFGIVCALLRARESGRGDIVDAAICDGTAALMANVFAWLADGRWRNARQANRLDGGAPFYSVYECADGKWIGVAALEPQFFALLFELIGRSPDDIGDRSDASDWPRQRAVYQEIFRGKTRDEWCALLEGTDACVAPLLDLEEAPRHAHNQARGVFVDAGGVLQPAPAPRFAGAAPELPPAQTPFEETGAERLRQWGLDEADIAALAAASAS